MKISDTYKNLRNLWLLFVVFTAQVVTAQTPTISNFSNFSYTSGTSPVLIAPNVSIANGNNYGDSYIEFEVSNAKNTETLSLTVSQTPINTTGVVSVVGTSVHLGQGSSTKVIGSVDATFDGTNGQKLRINFSAPLANATFTEGFDGANLPGWDVKLGPVKDTNLFTRTKGNQLTRSGAGPYIMTKSGAGGYSYTTDVDYSNSYQQKEGIVRASATGGGWVDNYNGTPKEPNTKVKIVNDPLAVGGKALKLESSGQIPSNNTNSDGSYGSAFGPEVFSDIFTATAGDQLALDWRAEGNGDDYEVYGYLLNQDNGARTLLFYGRGNNQVWTTASGAIPSSGRYKFHFINGTYDYTGRWGVGSNFYIDNIRVLTQDGTDAVATALARLVTYENTVCSNDASRTVTLRARSSAGAIGTAPNTGSITLIADTEKPVIAGALANITKNNDPGVNGANVTWTAPTATDNCTVTAFGSNYNSGVKFGVGKTTVTYTATDSSGNETTSSFEVTITDVEMPVIAGTPANITQDNDTGVNGANVTWTAPIASDNDGIDTFVSTHQPGDLFPIGTTTVTYTATDNSGNETTSSFDITVNDTESPVISSTSDITQANDTGECGAVITWTAPTASDNAAIDTFVSTHNSGDEFPVGATTVTYTATDVHQNVKTSSFTVTVNDAEKPVVVTQNITVQLDNNAQASILASDVDNGSTDNCGISSRTVVPNTFNASNLANDGENTVVLTVVDGKGNTSSANAVVTIEDTIAPNLISTDSANDPSVDNYACDSEHSFVAGPSSCVALVSIAKPDWGDNVGVVTTTQTANNNVALTNLGADVLGNFPVGNTIVKFTASDASGNTTSCSITVKVTDTQLPEITNCPTDLTVANQSGSCDTPVNLVIPTASDNCTVSSVTYQTSGATSLNGSDFPNMLTLNVGTTTILYTVTDASGNSIQCSYDVTVNDTEKPVISNTPAAITQVNDAGIAGAEVTWQAPTAADNCAVASFVSTHNSGDEFPIGTTTITYTATDNSGNEISSSFDVTVTDTEKPVISDTPAAIATSNDPGVNGAIVTWTPPTASDNAGIDTFVSTHDSGDLFPIGMSTVTYTATDNSGNVTTSSFEVTITDTEKPVITKIPADITQVNDRGVNGANVTWTAPTASDNAGVATLVSTPTSGDFFTVGTTTVTYTATDIHGNESTSSFKVTVTDTKKPVITNTPSAITKSNDAGVNGAIVTWTAPTASDNAAIATLESTHESGALFPIGQTTVTYTAADVNGNESTSSFGVTVNDTEKPVIANTPTAISKSNDVGVNGAYVAWTPPTASDNAAIATFVSTHESGALFLIGTTTVTYTATDIHGNEITSSFDIIINDTEKPVIANTPATISKSNDAGVNGAIVTWTAPTASDNAAIATLVSTHESGALFPVGTTTVTYTATDIYGNETSSSFEIAITDVEKPVIANTPSAITKSNDAGVNGAIVTWTAPTASDNAAIATFVSTYESGALFPIGTTTVTYTATDVHGNEMTSSFEITVNDTERPVITNIPTAITKSNDLGVNGAIVTWTAPTASDNAAIATFVSTYESGDLFAIGTTTVKYTAVDIHGNEMTSSFEITVNDTESPVISNTPSTITQSNDAGKCGALITWTAPTASDNAAMASLTGTHDSGDEFPVGTTTVTYTAKDIYGNETISSFEVTVNDTEKPAIGIASNIIFIDYQSSASECGAIVTWNEPEVTDNCSIARIEKSHESGDLFQEGETIVTYTITDIHENKTVMNLSVSINPYKLDCDGDGVSNAQEDIDGTDPNDSCSSDASSITMNIRSEFLDADCDGDGISNGDEIGPDPANPIDSDGDGVPDYLEFNNANNSEDDVEVFNLLTPNGDGKNDVFVIRNIELYPENTVEIYNRWGVKVYNVSGYGQNGRYFIGESSGRVTVKGNSSLPSGTYFYVLKYKSNGAWKDRKGYLNLTK